MKLNHDCIRALLLYLEENLKMNDSVDVKSIELKNFSNEDIVYSALKLREAEYISATADYDLLGYIEICVESITWEGHKFLDTVRDNKVWSTTKSVLSKLSSTSITITSSIASQVITNLINQQMGFAGTTFC